MFENLIESKQKGTRTIGQTILSFLVHGAMIFGAVKATQGVAETIKNRPVDTTMVFLKPPPPPPPPPDQPPPDVIVAANPPPKGFQTVVAPTDIPKDIPPDRPEREALRSEGLHRQGRGGRHRGRASWAAPAR